MDKKAKLSRYSQKDYSEVVDFPVEIVGRDGVVRRYGFEDSVRLYQRRITFAPIRYRDDDLVEAEVTHCRSRIDQLRRSYFHRFGWGTAEGETPPLQVFGDLAGELAAFLCRVLRSEGRPEVAFQAVSGVGEALSVWYVVPHGNAAVVAWGADAPARERRGDSGMLLYVHRFEGPSTDANREHFFGTLKLYERLSRTDGEQERLIAFHHTVDCGFILTARAGEFEGLISVPDEDDDPADLAPTTWDRALEVIRRGEHEEALRRCQQVVEEQPWHRNGYVAGAVLATWLDQPLVAEDLAMIGSRYFPDDAVLRYHTGVGRARSGRVDEALPELEVALRLAPGLVAARFLLVTLLLRRGRFADARRVLRERQGVRPDDRRGDALLLRLEQWLRWRGAMILGGASCAVLGLVAVVLGSWFGLLPTLLGVAMVLAGRYGFARQVVRLAERLRFDDVAYGLRRLERRGVGGEASVS